MRGAHADQEDQFAWSKKPTTMAIEKTRMYTGMYHVLAARYLRFRDAGRSSFYIKSLIERLKGGTVEEIIIATISHREGEATAVYLSKLLKPLGVRVLTRIGVGIPWARTWNMRTK